jgi:AraC-like DNA-binding protein
MTAPVSQALKDLIARQRKQYGPVDWNSLPPAKGINHKGYSTNPAAKWLKPLSVVSQRLPAAISPPSPTLPNRHERRASSRFDRQDRAKLARVLEQFNRETREVGQSGRRNQGALKASGVEIGKAMLFEWMNQKTGALFPSHETIAKVTGWSVSTVKRALKALAGVGVLHWVHRAVFRRGRWLRTSSSYRLGQRDPGTPSRILSKGFDGGLTVEARYCETLRNVAQHVGCKFLS